MNLKKNFPDLLVSAALIIAALFYAFKYVVFDIPPFEDAAMIMRYSQHLAQGHGVVWNIGEAPVDGATDFLFMVAAAAFIKLGLTVGQSVRGISFMSHLLTILIVYWANRRIHRGNIPLSFLSGLYLAVGVGFSYVSAYFGTPFFALAVAATWTLGLMLMKEAHPHFWLSLAFALSGLISGLIRPEGVILAALILISVALMRILNAPLSWKGVKESKIFSIIGIFGAVFLILGGTYFLWRWNYFGYPLPNPFYKKGGAWSWSVFRISMLNTLRLSLPLVFAFLLGLRNNQTLKTALIYLLPILGFASVFGMISNEMNYGARFQYATLPLALMSWIPFVGEIKLDGLTRLNLRERGARYLALTALALGVVYYSWYQNCFLTSYQKSCAQPYERDGRLEMAKMLADYRGKNYKIATTEAGLLPYYSGWNALDTWGLNDSFIAHNGKITLDYLDQYQPQVIMFHDYYSPLVPPKLTEANLVQRWFSMTILMKTYAEEHGYILAAVFGDSPYDTHYYYVRADFEDSEELVERISEFKDYFYPITGKRSINYAKYE